MIRTIAVICGHLALAFEDVVHAGPLIHIARERYPTVPALLHRNLLHLHS